MRSSYRKSAKKTIYHKWLVTTDTNQERNSVLLNFQPSDSFVYVSDAAALAELVDLMVSADRIALDTEADSLHHYYQKVCLMQITIKGRNYIVDPLTGLDLSKFLAVLAKKPLILHCADYDLRIMRSSFGFRNHNEIFDTMLAAQLLGYERFSLSAMVERFCGVVLSKKGQKSDWSRRPLSAQQLRYACHDTQYLEHIADKQLIKLRKLGRDDWLAQTVACMIRTTQREKPLSNPNNQWRIKGMRDLNRRELEFVRRIWYWREKQSQRADIPPFKIMGNQRIIELAQWAAMHPNAHLADGPKLPRHCTGKRFNALAQAIIKAGQTPESDLPEHRKSKQPQPKPAGSDTLRNECAKIAKQLNIAPATLASRATIEAIAKNRPKTIKEIIDCSPTITHWQAKLLQEPIKRTL